MRGFVLPIVLAALLSPFGGKAHRMTEDGNRHFELGEFAEALTDYTEAQVVAPESPRLHYDVGNVLYKQGDYEGAAEAFTRALVTAPAGLAPFAAYNLGNSRFQQEEFQAAADSYRRSLETRPDDLDAKRNLELALRALEQQQQQDQQPNESSDQQQENDPQQSGEPDPAAEPRTSEGGDNDSQEPQQGEDPATAEEVPDGMTAEQAERLLDSLADEEKKNLEQERQRKAAAARGKRREKDW
jgi:tetratricopeptide (TPR) repeat protein